MPQKEVQQVKKQHPVPQNIMSVEFKLIGDMTVRQFFYVVGGGVLALLFFKSGLPFIVRWFLTIASGILGAAMAFVPLEERGLDVWVKSFLKVLGTSTQMVWKKDPTPPIYLLSDYAKSITSDVLAVVPIKNRSKLYEYLGTLEQNTDNDPFEEKKDAFLSRLNFNLEPPNTVTLEKKDLEPLSEAKTQSISGVLFLKNTRPDRPIRNLPLEKELKLPTVKKTSSDFLFKKEPATKDLDLEKKTEDLKKTVEKIKLENSKEKGVSGTVYLYNLAQRIKSKVVNEAESSNKKPSPTETQDSILNTDKKLENIPPAPALQEKQDSIVRPIKHETPKQPQPPFRMPSNTPIKMSDDVGETNILKGRVSGVKGEVAEGALILIKDKDGDPERALKTNALGEFSTATRLENGEYTIEIKYQDQRFNVVNFTAEGRVIPFLEISAVAKPQEETGLNKLSIP